MSPTEIDKIAGKRYGYVPDYSIWIGGIPLVIVEAKEPDVAVQVGLREAQLYANQINKRYPPTVNPIGFVLASNGREFALSQWDSETEALIVQTIEAQPGTAALTAIQKAIGKAALEAQVKALGPHFQARRFFTVAASLGGQSKLGTQLGVNEFAEPLFPTLAKYFAASSEDTPDDVIDDAYVSTSETTGYEGVLETYLKDRSNNLGGNQFKSVETTKTSAAGVTSEVQKFASNPKFFSRVQLIVGSVGAGKSTFIRRYYRRLRSAEVEKRTLWGFVNFNVVLPGKESLASWIAQKFITSFERLNGIQVHDLKTIEKICDVELNQFERGTAKNLKKVAPAEYEIQRVAMLSKLENDSVKFVECISRHFSGERGLGIVVVFDNVDKRSRDEQLAIFEAAQWFKDITRALVIVNLRDSTFETHRDEPPLDAFANAINFYIKSPRFSLVIRKRLELMLEALSKEVDDKQMYSLSSGAKISYPATKLGAFLMTLYASVFDRRASHVASWLEALVAKDVRRALGMFGDIIVSPHIPTNQITGTVLSGGENRIRDNYVIKALMRGRYKLYNGKSVYIRNLLKADLESNRPSNLLMPDVLEYLIRNRKVVIDFGQEGYATLNTIVKKMGQLGYDESDAARACTNLVKWGLIEPDSLLPDENDTVSSIALSETDALRVHASGYIHMRYLLVRPDYLVGVSPDLTLARHDFAAEIGQLWANDFHLSDIRWTARRDILSKLRAYFEFEYERRCKRHGFYEEFGFGGKAVIKSIAQAQLTLDPTPTSSKKHGA